MLSMLITAMATYPEVQEKAQAELDRIVGPGRLPDFGDRDDLIYIKALISELLRWHQIAPFGKRFLYLYERNRTQEYHSHTA